MHTILSALRFGLGAVIILVMETVWHDGLRFPCVREKGEDSLFFH